MQQLDFLLVASPFLPVIAAASVVYDSIEMSPNYDNTPGDLYIDERELIELPAPH